MSKKQKIKMEVGKRYKGYGVLLFAETFFLR